MKLKAAYETEVFINKPGYLTIKQEDGMGNDPAVVMLTPEQAERVIREMRRVLEDKARWWDASASRRDPA